MGGGSAGAIAARCDPGITKSGKTDHSAEWGVYWYKFNTEKVPFNNAKIRKGFAYAINRKEIVENVNLPNQLLTAQGAVPPTVSLKPDGYFKDNDAETAKKLLAEGMKELGLAKLPPITLSYNTSERHKQIAETIQDQWKKSLGVDVKIKNKEWKVYLEDLHTGNFQIGRMGWLGDFNDPVNFLELFKEKTGGQNDTNWENAEYKELLNKSMLETDEEKRKQILAKAEEILMDEMPVVPVMFYTHAYVKNEKLKGVVIDGLG